MSRALPPLNALRAFESAGRHQSFSRAADELGVSHSSISRRVRGLEDRLGVQLFRDLPRGLALSPDGAAYLAQITPALDAIGEATEQLGQTPAGTVTVNAEPLFAHKWLMPRLKAFHDAHPGIELRIEASRTLADVARYEADLAIRFIGQQGAYPGSELISDAAVYPFAAPDLISAPLTHPRDFLNYRLFKDRNLNLWEPWFALAGGVAPQDVPHFNWRLRSQLSLEAALSGQGILLTSQEIVDLDVAAGRLIQVSKIGLRSGAYHLIRGEGALRRKPVRIFRDWLLASSEVWRST